MQDFDKTKEQLIMELNEERRKFTDILERIKDGFFALDKHSNFTYVNKEAQKIFKLHKEELIGKYIWSLHPDSKNTIFYIELNKAIRENKSVQFEHHGLRTGKWYEVKVYPSENGLSVFFIDITEKKLIEKELFRLESLNIIGEISASISHEIRNPLTTIKGFLQLLGEREVNKNNQEYYNIMIDEINRANSIITEFLSLAGKNKSVLQSRNINTILDSLNPLVYADALTSNKTIELNKGDIPDILLDENEIRQLIFNLIRNGLEAMPSKGKLIISTLVEEDEVILTVEDHGNGIKPEILDRVWVPFFTTKDNGTGLGLAICYEIIKRHNGRIEIKTSPLGTTFLVRFKTESTV